MSQPEPDEEALWAGWIVLAPISADEMEQPAESADVEDLEEPNVDECCF
jgi:hypothetical protein